MDGFKFVIPYYENPGMLVKQIENWNQYSKTAQQKIEVIIIDDGSPRNPALNVILKYPPRILIKLLRIKENIPWNQHGARNLGAKFACSEGWLFVTDIDHVLTPEMADKLLSKELNTRLYYIFNRVSAPEMEPYKIHHNSFLVQRSTYWKVGGYDEDFCGFYGGDGVMLGQLNNICSRTLLKDITLIRVPREVQPDASTVDWDRAYYKAKYREILERKKKNNDWTPRNPLRFTWERLL